MRHCMHKSQLACSQDSTHYDSNAAGEEDAAIRHGFSEILELRRFVLSQKTKKDLQLIIDGLNSLGGRPTLFCSLWQRYIWKCNFGWLNVTFKAPVLQAPNKLRLFVRVMKVCFCSGFSLYFFIQSHLIWFKSTLGYLWVITVGQTVLVLVFSSTHVKYQYMNKGRPVWLHPDHLLL